MCVCDFFFIEYRLPISRLRVERHGEFMYKGGDPQACKKVNKLMLLSEKLQGSRWKMIEREEYARVLESLEKKSLKT